jgi:hypothetical protein
MMKFSFLSNFVEQKSLKLNPPIENMQNTKLCTSFYQTKNFEIFFHFKFSNEIDFKFNSVLSSSQMKMRLRVRRRITEKAIYHSGQLSGFSHRLKKW